MTEPITLQVTKVAGHAVVAVSGEIDISSVPDMRAAIDAVLTDGTRQLIVDLDGVRFMDSTGLNLLIGVVKQLGPGTLGVVANRSSIRRIFSISGIDQVIPLYESVAAAVEAASKGTARE
jgi:anti-sigma B factor antagonist